MFEIQATRSNISADEDGLLCLVKAKIVLLSLIMIHVTVQLVYMSTCQHHLLIISCLLLLLIFSYSEEVPVELVYQTDQEVDQLTVAQKDNAFLVLVSV